MYSPNQQYPADYAARNFYRAAWAHPLDDCLADFSLCCLTSWCPCITFGRIAEILDQGSSSCTVRGAMYLAIGLTGFPCFYSCFYRTKMRQQFNLEEGPCKDCWVHFFCEPCALCQEYRELKSRGFDMSRGWQGNGNGYDGKVAMTSMAPEVHDGMKR